MTLYDVALSTGDKEAFPVPGDVRRLNRLELKLVRVPHNWRRYDARG